jgi:SRSO17 transposase
MINKLSDLFVVHGHDHTPTAEKYMCGLVQSERANMERMEEVVKDVDYQTMQQFITDSPWDQRAVMDRIAQDANELFGADPDCAMLIDETSFIKKGSHSVGVARQWSGRMGKVENCQVAVFGVLNAGTRSVPVDARLYLPTEWVDDPARCRNAGVPQDEIVFRTKHELALQIVRHQRDLGTSFKWVCADGFYGKNPQFLRALEDDGERFIIDVHSDQRIYLEDPCPGEKSLQKKTRRTAKPKKEVVSVRVDKYVSALDASVWRRRQIRPAENGPLEIDFYRKTVWVWDGEESRSRCWQLVVRRDVPSGQIKYALSNAPGDVPDQVLVKAHAQRFWVERTFEDAKKEASMADYQVRQWLAWHHHIAMVMMVLLFMTRQRMVHAEEHPLLTCYDIRCLLAHFLPRRDVGEAEILRQMRIRHEKRQAARHKRRGQSGTNADSIGKGSEISNGP